MRKKIIIILLLIIIGISCVKKNKENFDTLDPDTLYLNKIKTTKNVNHTDKFGVAFIHKATKRNFTNSLKYLIENNANLNIQEPTYGNTAIYMAIGSFRPKAMKLLIENGADLTVKRKDNQSPKDFFIKNYHSELFWWAFIGDIKKLKLNFDKFSPKEKQSVILYTAYENIMDYLISKHVVEITKNKPNRLDLLSQATGINTNFTLVKFLISNKAKINYRTINNTTPLFPAAENGNYKIVKYLLDNGADTSLLMYGKNSALFFATKHRRLSIIKLLVSRGMKINKTNELGENLLHWAAMGWKGETIRWYPYSKVDVIDYLLKKGLDINSQNNKAENALFYAIKSNDLDTVKYLVENGIDADDKNNKGILPLDYAKSKKYKEIFDYLNKRKKHDG